MKKIKKISAVLGGVLATAAPLISVVACGKSNEEAGTIITFYYDENNDGIVKLLPKVKAAYQARIDEAVTRGKMSAKVKLVMKSGGAGATAQNKMVDLWGYRNSKSPDLWVGGKQDTQKFYSRSGNSAIHQFSEEEYSKFVIASGFKTDKSDWGTRKDGKGKAANTKVYDSIPYANKGFFNVRFDETPTLYDENRNENLSKGDIRLSNSSFTSVNAYKQGDIDMKNTLIAMNNAWNQNPFLNAIMSFLRGNQKDDSTGNAWSRSSTNGNSNSIADFAYIPHAPEDQLQERNGEKVLKNNSNISLNSILWKDKTYKQSGNELSEIGVAINQMIMQPTEQSQYIKDQTGKALYNLDKINSIGYLTVPEKFRLKTESSIMDSEDLNSILGFMGSSTQRDTQTTAGNLFNTTYENHQYKNLLGAGVDWVKLMTSNILQEGNLQKDGKPTDEKVNETLSHYHVYRMPLDWVMDDDAKTFELTTDASGNSINTTKLDSKDIPGVTDNVATVNKIYAQVDGDAIQYNERTWEIRDEKVRNNKIEALKIFTSVLYGELDGDGDNKSQDELNYAQTLLRDAGIYSGKSSLLLAGQPAQTSDPNHGGYATEQDRLNAEVIKALSSTSAPTDENYLARVKSDYSKFGKYYWEDGMWKYSNSQEQYRTPYGMTKGMSDIVHNSVTFVTQKSELGTPNDIQ